VTTGSDPSGEPKTAPLDVVVPPAIGSSPGDVCPSCGAKMAIDQRYCLNCGTRRGDPRLPFMDAVVFMETSKRPKDGAAAAAAAAPPPPPAKSGLSPSTTLVAGIATLVLAIGVGVLIGRSGNNSAPVANQAPPIIKVGGGEVNSGSGEEEAAAAKNAGKEAKAGNSKKQSGGKAKKAPDKQVGSSGTSEAAEKVLKPKSGVKLPPPTTKVGEQCEKGSSGCSESGEFNGNFFGE
jgi:hypothetical protein